MAGVPLSAVAVTFYGLAFGGFVVQAAMGVLAASIVTRAPRRYGPRLRVIDLLVAAAASVPGVVALALLDLVIGPW